MTDTTTRNSNLHSARSNSYDEFYTNLSDIEKEMGYYAHLFKGRDILLNCDDDTKSHFWTYFKLNMEFLGINSVTGTHYDAASPTFKVELIRNEDGFITQKTTKLKTNGDFRSAECSALLKGNGDKKPPIVITNPPFSIFREFAAAVIDNGNDFIIIGSCNAVTYKEFFPLIQSGKVWTGVNNGSKMYKVPDHYEGKTKTIDDIRYAVLGNTWWFTNLIHEVRHREIHLVHRYNEKDYPSYENYDAIEVSQVAKIPMDYDGVMGVPISFLTKHNPDQFEIVGIAKRGAGDPALKTKEYTREDSPKYGDLNAGPVLKIGNTLKNTFPRLLIKRKK